MFPVRNQTDQNTNELLTDPKKKQEKQKKKLNNLQR